MRKPVIHLYTACWNEEYMLPFFFRHYDEIVDRYIIFDDGSTDNTVAMLKAHPKVEVRFLSRPEDLESVILAGLKILNNCWKESRGEADWVIVTDMDEHIYHKDLIGYVTECRKQGATLIPGIGYQMLSTDLPDSGSKLTEVVTRGAPFTQMNKLNLFDPNRIVEINFGVGKHLASPTGEVAYPAHDEVLILHYKYLSLDRTHVRHSELGEKLRKMDKEQGWGHKYSWKKEELAKDWEMFNANAIDNVMSPGEEHIAFRSRRERLWWRQ